MTKVILMLTALMVVGAVMAFPEVPKDSAKALKITRGKPFSEGIVFINGKYVAPPYVVERWGTGLRINKQPISGQIVEWSEFLKTQTDVKVSKSEVIQGTTPVAVTVQPAKEDDYSSALDDLFDDIPKPKTPARKPAVTAPAIPKPKTIVSYSIEGDYVMNDASKAMVKRINDARSEIDRMLRTGCFMFFGDAYSRVSGDSRASLELLNSLPDIQRKSESLEEFKANVRAANLVYINDALCEELYRNRIDYRVLGERLAKIKEDMKFQQVLRDASKSTF